MQMKNTKTNTDKGDVVHIAMLESFLAVGQTWHLLELLLI